MQSTRVIGNFGINSKIKKNKIKQNKTKHTSSSYIYIYSVFISIIYYYIIKQNTSNKNIYKYNN